MASKQKQKIHARKGVFYVRAVPAVGVDSDRLAIQPTFQHLRIERPAGTYIYPRHQHEVFELILVARGGLYRSKVNDVQVELPANSVLVVQPGDWHEEFCERPLEFLGITVSLTHQGSTENVRLFRKNIKPAGQWTSFRTNDYIPLINKMAAESNHHDVSASRIQDALMHELFWRMVRAFDPGRLASWLLPNASDANFRSQIESCFEMHMHHSPPISEMARTLRISQRTFSERCNHLFNLSPAKAFMRYRIEQAHEYLTTSGATVKEACYHFGFSNPYHFSRVFKQVLGHSPSSDKGVGQY